MTRKFVLALILNLLVLVAGNLAQASSAAICEGVFAGETHIPHVGSTTTRTTSVFNAREQLAIEKLLGSDLPGREKWAQITNLYLNARLRDVPESLRAVTRTQLHKFRPRFKANSEIRTDTKSVAFPMEYIDTPLPYVVLAHEWEHHIRSLARSNGSDVHAMGFLGYFNAAALYVEEGAAMSAEWEISRLISDQEAEQILSLTEASNEPRNFKSFARNMIAHRALDRQAYVKGVRDTGRYSFAHTLRKTATRATLWVVVPTASLAPTCSLVYWLFN